LGFAIDPDEYLVKMPTPLRPGPHLCGRLLFDPGRIHRSKPVPPNSYRFVADIDPSFMKQILDLSQRQRKADIHHHSQSDDLRRSLEISERISHARRLRGAPHRLKLVSPDTAVCLDDGNRSQMLPGKTALMAVDGQSRQISSRATPKIARGDLDGYDFDGNRDSYGEYRARTIGAR